MEHSVCFIGHRKIQDTPQLRERLWGILTELMENGTVNFLFGDHSEFNSLCYELVSQLKEERVAVRRIHFRTNYEDPDEYTMRFLLAGYEESVCPKGVGGAGRASYVKRNYAMIRESETCVFYYDESSLPKGGQSKSGTAIAFDYAKSQKKVIVNCFE